MSDFDVDLGLPLEEGHRRQPCNVGRLFDDIVTTRGCTVDRTVLCGISWVIEGVISWLGVRRWPKHTVMSLKGTCRSVVRGKGRASALATSLETGDAGKDTIVADPFNPSVRNAREPQPSMKDEAGGKEAGRGTVKVV